MGKIVRQGFLIAAKDTRIFVRDRFALGFALLFPVMFVLGFSLALGNVGPSDSQLVLTVTTQEPQGGESYQIINDLTRDPAANVRYVPYDQAQAALNNKSIQGFVSFPKDFSTNLLAGDRTQVQVVVRGSDTGTEAALQGMAQAIAGRINEAEVALKSIAQLRAAEGQSLTQDDLNLVLQQGQPVAFKEDKVADIQPFKASDFTLPGYLTMFVFFAAALSAEAIARERQNNTLERLMSNGAGRGSIILGKYLAATYKGLIQLAILWLVGVFAFGINLGQAPAAVIFLSILLVLASAGFGIMLASLVRTVRSSASIAVLTALLLAPIGGCWWPLFITPSWMQTLAKLTPHGWANDGFNKLMLFGASTGDVIPNMVALVVFGIVFIAIALWRFKLEPSA